MLLLAHQTTQVKKALLNLHNNSTFACRGGVYSIHDPSSLYTLTFQHVVRGPFIYCLADFFPIFFPFGAASKDKTVS